MHAHRAHLFLFALFLPQALPAQTPIIAQIADGGGWQTTIVVTNTSASPQNVTLAFFQSTTNGATTSWNPPLLEVNSTQNMSVPAASALFLHTQGTAGIVSEGWAQVQASSSIVAYAIFTQRVPGRTDQDGTALATPASTRLLFPFDNTNGAVDAMAIANPSSSSESVSVSLESAGAVTQPSPIALPQSGYTVFVMPTQYPSTNAKTGLAEFNVTSGGISAVPLRFNSSGGFTVAPGYPESGPPIIGGSPGVGNPYSSFTPLNLTYNAAGYPSNTVAFPPFQLNSDDTFTFAVNGSGPTFTNGTFTSNGTSFTANALLPSNSIPPFGLFFAPDGSIYKVVSASMSFTATQSQVNGKSVQGSLVGTLTGTGTPYPNGGNSVTVSGPISGAYTAVLK